MGERWRNNRNSDNAWFKGGTGRGSGRPPDSQIKMNSTKHEVPTKIKTNTSKQEVPTKFKEASANMQASIQKHVSNYESSSEEEDLEEAQILDSVTGNYIGQGNMSLGKTREFLEQSFQSGAAICLVCIASVKRVQPIWSCGTCFTAFHLPCIQRWASSTIYQQTESSDPTVGDLPVRVKSFKKIEWCCPKCRCSYKQENVPNKYECFCGKVRDPEFQPWLIPHSCGATCDKALKPDCGHRCLLLCHPGSCPPCPKMINMLCNCKQSDPKPVRCSVHNWSCTKTCNKILTCNLHKCEEKCHPGECEPCPKTSLQTCQCKKFTVQRPCADSEWRCDTVCGKPFACGFHKCEEICHVSVCGDCPFTGLQKCPCGAVHKEVTCPNEVTSCGGTCDKLLLCGEHMCPNKCHKGQCPQCLKLVDKTCRCRLHVKQLPCHKQYLCETKCKIMKECGRHACNKKCCDGECPPCDKVCGKTLQCKKHKCPNTCHTGLCYPCPLTAKVTCRCNGTYYSVPCGVERNTKPPKCMQNCKLPFTCDHIKENLHKCHFGACPPCKQKCGKTLPCGHKCSILCHNAVPVLLPLPKPAGPWEVQAPKIEIRTLPCLPCKVPVTRPCLGGHENGEFPCSEARVTSCGRQCGRPLKCTNHTCSRDCHSVQPSANDEVFTDCENCSLLCRFSRPEGCKHPCTKPCHPPPCDKCQQFLKKQCHCGLTELYIRCCLLTDSDESVKSETLSCKQQCSRMLGCGHRCSFICHSGECSKDCSKKTRVFCACRRIKKEMPCDVVRQNEVNIPCDEICKEKKLQQLNAKKEEEDKKRLEEDEKNQKELEEFERKFGKKRSRGHRTKDIAQKNNVSFWAKYKYIVMAFAVVVVSSIIVYVNI
ncbi:NF-X1-type zinc finger protein NFXL1 [Arctopsyche grandis]|uniref:NF-X1-type zinc finger protein NFXL1 n=1 Tax=Arctopsyche grandis TaxID=121162 RepID=UPI00406D9052